MKITYNFDIDRQSFQIETIILSIFQIEIYLFNQFITWNYNLQFTRFITIMITMNDYNNYNNYNYIAGLKK